MLKSSKKKKPPVIWVCMSLMYMHKHIFYSPRGETSVLRFLGESAWSLQLSGYPRLCRNSQLPGPDASCGALFPEALLRGGSARGVHAPQPDRSGEADKVWWDSGGTLKSDKLKWRCSSLGNKNPNRWTWLIADTVWHILFPAYMRKANQAPTCCKLIQTPWWSSHV